MAQVNASPRARHKSGSVTCSTQHRQQQPTQTQHTYAQPCTNVRSPTHHKHTKRTYHTIQAHHPTPHKHTHHARTPTTTQKHTHHPSTPTTPAHPPHKHHTSTHLAHACPVLGAAPVSGCPGCTSPMPSPVPGTTPSGVHGSSRRGCGLEPLQAVQAIHTDVVTRRGLH
jgi:hypothetical protein